MTLAATLVSRSSPLRQGGRHDHHRRATRTRDAADPSRPASIARPTDPAAAPLAPHDQPPLVLIISFIVFTGLNPRFAARGTVGLVLQQVAVIAGLAIGQTLVILTAGIDLSVGAITILSMFVMAELPPTRHSGLLALLLGIVVRHAVRPYNGAAGDPAQPATVHRHPGHVEHLHRHRPAVFRWPGDRTDNCPRHAELDRQHRPLGGFRSPTASSSSLVLAAGDGFILSQTAWGRHVYAVGDDPEASRLSDPGRPGPADRVHRRRAHLRHAAWVLIGRAGAASPNAIRRQPGQHHRRGHRRHRLFGGRGAVVGPLLGALIVGVFRTGLPPRGGRRPLAGPRHRRPRHRGGRHRPVDPEGEA